MRVLVSGASIAGPVLAYWLTHHGASTSRLSSARRPCAKPAATPSTCFARRWKSRRGWASCRTSRRSRRVLRGWMIYRGGRPRPIEDPPHQDLPRHLRSARGNHARRPQRDLLCRRARRRRVRVRRLDHEHRRRRRGDLRAHGGAHVRRHRRRRRPALQRPPPDLRRGGRAHPLPRRISGGGVDPQKPVRIPAT